ncbi:phosphoserine phosphatase [Streptococcus pneumoniae 2070335]|nr:phosphoserine phosphatase [Streptococcus pneumoniae 2070335]EJG55939.1 phosphoserine phosphatase [Streptococcus pneumoniae 2061376]VMX54328.1 phosphoserine phosphatase [Streptococcus pneumoniae]
MSQVKGLCVLDVDGTLILEEVIDLLGREAGHEAEISQITSRAMRGELVFESSLRKECPCWKVFLFWSLITSSTQFIYR